MKLLVQWALSAPADWEEIEAKDWPSLPAKPDPAGTDPPIDAHKGWVNGINIQGLMFTHDHYCVEHLAHDRCRITAWDDEAPGQRHVVVWTVQTLAEDKHGRINTRQQRTIYAEDLGATRWIGVPDVRPWSEWAPPAPALVRHGKWLSDDLYARHVKVRRNLGWRDFTEGVDPALLDAGRVPHQRRKR